MNPTHDRIVRGPGLRSMTLNVVRGAEALRPLATVVIGGIISSSFLVLIVSPILYYWTHNDSGTTP